MIENTIQSVKEAIQECAYSCGRNQEDIKILAVTKTQSVESIERAIRSGIDLIGESRVQEAVLKIPKLHGLFKEFHFIGHLQANKINKLLTLNPVLIHSIDKFSTAEKLNSALMTNGTYLDVLIELNTSGEITKHGISPSEASELIKRIEVLEYVKVRGLMTIGSLSNDENIVRNCFYKLRQLFERIKSQSPDKMQYLSMGMSSDYKLAIKEGANILRLGSILFQHNTE